MRRTDMTMPVPHRHRRPALPGRAPGPLPADRPRPMGRRTPRSGPRTGRGCSPSPPPGSSPASRHATCSTGGGTAATPTAPGWSPSPPPPEVDPHGAAAFWANLARHADPVAAAAPALRQSRTWRGSTRWTGRQLTISVWVPGTVPPGAVEAADPRRLARRRHHHRPTPPHRRSRSTYRRRSAGTCCPPPPSGCPLHTDHDTDPLRALIAAGAGLRDRRARLRADPRPARHRPPRPPRPPRRRPAARRQDRRTGDSTRPPRCCGCSSCSLPGRRTARGEPRRPPAGRRDPGVERDVRAILDKTVATRCGRSRSATPSPPTATAQRPQPALAAGCAGSPTRSPSAFAVYTGRNRLRHRTRMPPPRRRPRRPAARRGFLRPRPELAALAALPARPRRARPGPGPRQSRCPPRSPSPPADAAPRSSARRGRRPRGRPGRAGRPPSPARGRLHRLREDHPAGQHDPRRHQSRPRHRRHRPARRPGPRHPRPAPRRPSADRVVLFDPDQPNPPHASTRSHGDDHDLVVDNLVVDLRQDLRQGTGGRGWTTSCGWPA